MNNTNFRLCYFEYHLPHNLNSISVIFLFQPKFKLKGIAFNAEYLVEVSLISDERKWHGKMTFWTPDCSELQPLDQTHCLEDISNKPKLVTKPSTTTESLRLGNIFLTGKINFTHKLKNNNYIEGPGSATMKQHSPSKAPRGR